MPQHFVQYTEIADGAPLDAFGQFREENQITWRHVCLPECDGFTDDDYPKLDTPNAKGLNLDKK